LVPKKAEEHIKPTAEVLGVSEDLVQDITSFYWTDVRKALVDLKGPNIHIENLGTFKIKHWKLDEIEANYKYMIERYQERQETRSMSFQRFSIMKDLENQVDKIQNVRKGLAAEETKKQQVKERRDEYKKNMDSQKTDL
jgi:hypothetical protein